MIATVELHENPPKLFNAFFDKLAGTDQLRKQLLSGKKASEIRDSWRSDLEQYARIRNKYLLYPD
ncbi:hypothetical protein CEN47_24615 [Fischerella thermalis CCMEE 5319]|nr:hypothetical protein CEN47_24615 [Fischerella thermalis CCMEE 5319]